MRHANGEGFIEDLADEHFARTRLAPRDKALCQELVYGAVRWQATLDWVIASRTDNRPQKVTLQVLLRLGLYQMFWLDRIPDHAAVNETVQLCKELGYGPQSGFINAVLRGCLRDRAALTARIENLRATQPALGYSHPSWLFESWANRWGADKARALCEWNNRPAPTFARLNELRATAESLRRQWSLEGVEASMIYKPWLGDVAFFELAGHPPLASLESHRLGMFYVQDPSTALAVAELNPKPGEVVLDYCAAPGGKTALIAQRMKNEGRVIACDVAPKRLERLAENCTRLGAKCVEVMPTEQALAGLNGKCDRVLVDVPCSNTGVLRRRVDARWRLKPEQLTPMAAMQYDILRRTIPLVKPGGLLVYSTCSLEGVENGEVVRRILESSPVVELVRESDLLPVRDAVDGAYAATLRIVR